ncbi:MAG: hypothetical protein ABJM29_00005 [Rhizobiaceae bacterium]
MATTGSPKKLSWRQRILIAVALCAAGIIYALAAFLDEIAGYPGERGNMMSIIIWFLPLSGIGALISGLLLASGFGRPGKMGWFWALITGVVATALSGAVGGTLIFPGFGTGLGPVFALGHMVQFPLLTMVWLALMVGLHMLARKIRGIE